MKLKNIFILLLTMATATVTHCQNIWRAPSQFNAWANFSSTVSINNGVAGTDTCTINTTNTRTTIVRKAGFVNLKDSNATMGNGASLGYLVGASQTDIQLQQNNVDSVHVYFVDDTCVFDGLHNVVAYKFIPALTAGNVNAWGLFGNAGTNPSTNFIGTTDNVALVFKTKGEFSGLLNGAGGNTSFGKNALNLYPLVASFNTAIGANSLNALDENSIDNTSLGFEAGGEITNGENCVFIGRQSRAVNDTAKWVTAIGSNAEVGCDSCMVLGDTTTTKAVGIGTAYPTAKLDVHGTFKLKDGTQGAGKVLTSDASGLAHWGSGQLPSVKDTLDDLLTGSIALVNNKTNVIVADAAITATEFIFPSGADGDAIIINNTRVITTLTKSGTGTDTITAVKLENAALAGTTQFNNIGGNWY